MSDNIRNSSSDFGEPLNRRDLEIILEVNKKAIEIETGVADQNEEIIALLNRINEDQKIIKVNNDDVIEKGDEILKHISDLNKEIFKLQVLFVTGLLSLVVQIIQIFIKK